MTKPELSIVMSVYNGATRLRETIDSILGQTFRQYEFIIINDGSTDESLDILSEYAANDPRIRVLSQENVGLAASLNRGIREAKGRLIARQDAGDTSHPTRLETQLKYLASNPHLKIVGTQFNYVVNGSIVDTIRFPCSSNDIRNTMLNSCCIMHGTAIFEKAAFFDIGGYREEFRCGQDYELWIRFTAKYNAENLLKVLYDYHIETNSTTFSRLPDQVYFTHLARWTHYYYLLGQERIDLEMRNVRYKILGGYLYWLNVVMGYDNRVTMTLLEKAISYTDGPAHFLCKVLLALGYWKAVYHLCRWHVRQKRYAIQQIEN